MIEITRDDLLTPIWEGNTVYRETGMFVTKNDRLPLIYKPDKILKVTSYGDEKEYVEGKDFILESDGTISLTEDTSIPCISEEEYYSDDPTSLLVTNRNGKDVRTYWGEGTTMTRWQIAVTYTYNGKSDSPIPPCRSDRYKKLLSKLENGEDVTFIFNGDSITAGASASFHTNTPPYMPSWQVLFTEAVAKKYGYRVHYVKTDLTPSVKVPEKDSVYGDRGTVTYINTAVGGWKIFNAIENFDEHVTRWIGEYGCDLFVLAFGMNDKRNTADVETESMRTILDNVLALAPSTSLLAVSTMLPNAESTNGWFTTHDTFEDAMIPMADEYYKSGIPCAVAPMTTLSRFICSRKRFRDHSGNNINHPNDFTVRIYAQVLIRTLLR